MIEFIVLGRIPGTEIYITFNWLIVVIVCGILIYDMRKMLNRKPDVIEIKKTTSKS